MSNKQVRSDQFKTSVINQLKHMDGHNHYQDRLLEAICDKLEIDVEALFKVEGDKAS